MTGAGLILPSFYTGKGYVGDPQKSLGALLHNAVTSGKDPSPKAKLPPQTLSVAYGAASAEIQILVRKSLAKTTTEDLTFVWGASGAICHWLDSVKPAMAAMGENTKDQAKLLEAARQAGKDAPDSILEFIPEEQEPQLTPVFPKATCLLAPALAMARRYTDEAL